MLGGMSTPEQVERDFTLLTAAARHAQLSARDSLIDDQQPPLSRGEALELLALGELIARKAGYGRQLAVRTAREAGASWSQIGAALGTSKQAAWEAHARWIEEQGLSEEDVAAARALAGQADKA
jgi:hypothetical protein